MELTTTIEFALFLSKRERKDFLTYLLTMALEESKRPSEDQPLNDNHSDHHNGKPE